MLLRITAILCVLGFLCLNDANAQPTTVRPYKFGFTIDEQQHRKEQRDERGIVMGEFGFITADGIYHLTVYATDENGKFRILAMRNYPYAPVEPKPTTTTTELPRPASSPSPPPRYNFNNDACSGCSLLNGKGSKPSSIAPNAGTKTEIRPLSQPLPVDVPRPGSVEEIEALRKVVPDLINNIDEVQAITGQLPPNLGTLTQTLNTQPDTYTQTQPQLVQNQATTRSPLIVTGKVSSSSANAKKSTMNINYFVGEEAKKPAVEPNKLSLSTPTHTQNTQPNAQTQTTPIDTQLLDEIRIGSAVAAKGKLDAQKQNAAQTPSSVTGSVPSQLTTPTKYTQVDYNLGEKAKTPTAAQKQNDAEAPSTPSGGVPSKLTTPTKYTQVDYNLGENAKIPTADANKLSSGGAPNAIVTPLKVKLDRQVLQSPSGGLFTGAYLPLTPTASPLGGALASPVGNTFGGLGAAPAAKLPSSATTGKPNANQISSSPSPLIVPPANAKYSAGNTKASKPILSAVTPLGISGATVSPADFGTQIDNQTPLYALIDTPQSTVGRITPGSLLVSTPASPKKQNKYEAGISDAMNNVIVPLKEAVVADRKTHQPTLAHTQNPQAPQNKNNLNKIATQPSQQPTAKQPQTQTGIASKTPTNTALNAPNANVPLTQTQTNKQQPGLNAIGGPNTQTPQAGKGSTPSAGAPTVSGNNAPQAGKAPGIDIRFDKTATPQATGKPGSPGRGSSGSSGSIDDTGDLYRFKYILDYNGHTETGGGNGNKVGNYFVIGDDDVERTIEYIANEFGFQPQVRWRKVNAKELPKDNTLKDYEFTWFKKE